MGIFYNNYISIARLSDKYDIKDNEKLICKKDQLFLISKMEIYLPTKHIIIDVIDNNININKIKALLKLYNKDCDLECEEPYNVYYVGSLFISFNYTSDINFHKCINIEDDTTIESFQKKIQETIKKKESIDNYKEKLNILKQDFYCAKQKFDNSKKQIQKEIDKLDSDYESDYDSDSSQSDK